MEYKIESFYPLKGEKGHLQKQGRSHGFDIGGAQASKIILGPFCLTYWGAQTLLLL